MRSFFVRQKLVKCNKRVPMIFLTLIDTPENKGKLPSFMKNTDI